MKEYTIIRRRTVVQVQTDQVQAETEAEALEIANKDQRRGAFHEANEWHMETGYYGYLELTSDDILEVTEVERA